MAIILTNFDHIENFFKSFNMFLHTILQICLPLIFPQLQLRLANRVKQVKYGLVVDLNIRAFDFKIDLYNPFIFEDSLVIQRFACT